MQLPCVGKDQLETPRARRFKTRFVLRSGDHVLLFPYVADTAIEGQAIELDTAWKAWHSAQGERAVEDGKHSAQREVSKEIRQEAADWRKAFGYSGQKHGKVVPFEGFADFIEKMV